MQGWILLHRQIFEHWTWQDKPFSKGQAWIDLLLLVNHQDNKFLHGKKLIETKRGQRVLSIRQLADRWGWSRTKVTDFLKILESEKMVTVKSDTKKTLVTVENYDFYQTMPSEKKPPEKAAKKPQKSLNNNDNNDKSLYNAHFLEFWELYPRKVEKKKAYKNWEARIKEKVPVEQMILAATNYSNHCLIQKTEPQYIKHPSTFLGKDKPFEDWLNLIELPKRPEHIEQDFSKYDVLTEGFEYKEG